MWSGDLTREVLLAFVEAAGPRQRERLTAWESARWRRRATRGEVMVAAIIQKADALSAVAKGVDGLAPEDALEVLGLAATMTDAKLGALVSLVRDLADLSHEDRAEVLGWAEASVPIAETTPRPPRAARASAPSSGRPMRGDRAKRLAFVETRGRVTMEEFRAHLGLTKTTACHWLTKAADDGLIHRESKGVYVSLAMATSTASEAGGS